MSLKLTAESFLRGVSASGLLEQSRLDSFINDLRSQGTPCDDATILSEKMQQRGLITPWQSDKLLQGRHKGFILGRYKLLNLLGRGEMSAVYLAEHIAMQRRCAIKVLPGNRVKDTSYLGRFHREARAVASLDHPNIVRAYDVDHQSESGTEIHFLVMEYVDGTSLEEKVKDHGQQPYVEMADQIRQAAEGLAHAHEAGLIHRDIKPGNILISKDGTVKLLDLGLARFFQSEGEESLTIKHDEKVLGTADYLAPEQAVDSHNVDQRADIYSLGCTFYYGLTGHPPFTDGTLVQRLLAHQTKTPAPITEDRPGTPNGLIKIIDKMMKKDKSERYQKAKDLARDLTRWLAHHGTESWKKQNVHLMADVFGIDALISARKSPRNASSGQSSAQIPTQPRPAAKTIAQPRKLTPQVSTEREEFPNKKTSQVNTVAVKEKPSEIPVSNLSRQDPSHSVKRFLERNKSAMNLSENWLWITGSALLITVVSVFGFSFYYYSSIEKPRETVPNEAVLPTEQMQNTLDIPDIE